MYLCVLYVFSCVCVWAAVCCNVLTLQHTALCRIVPVCKYEVSLLFSERSHLIIVSVVRIRIRRI